ncbi:MAG: Spy/CpxP family protein refolding chaperone [Desulfuromonadales bacterium]|nr:Spy/CpxP family protein refolding chaperone [Desulfuromonadales bacterium]
MKNFILIVTLSLITLLGSALYVAAAPSGAPCGGPCDGRCATPGDGKVHAGGHFLERMTRILDLSEAQQASIKQVQAAEQEKTAALHEKKRELRQQLRQVETANALDENAVRVLSEQRGAIETELSISRARTHNQIDALLTPEQRQLAAKLRPEAGEKRKGGKGLHR